MAGKRTGGFTLIELLCALGVLAIVAATALPSWSAALPRLALDRAARQLVSEVELARVKAISRNTRVRALFDLGRAEYETQIDSEGRFIGEGTRHLPSGVAFDAGASTRVSGGRISITFQPRGNTVDNATIALAANPGTHRKVIVSAGGRVRVE